jgi:hypothetical protein
VNLFSAKGAAFTKTWGNAPGFSERKVISAESAIYFQHLFDQH